MSTRDAAPSWLARAYALALVLHAGLVAGLVGLAIHAAGTYGAGANAARSGMALTALVLVTGLIPAVPSVIALLSWWLCRRRGWLPSTGHMALTVTALAAIAILFGVAHFS